MIDKNLIEKGVCPCCGNIFYVPSSYADEFAYHIAFGLHFPNCPDNPNKNESDLQKLMKEIIGE